MRKGYALHSVCLWIIGCTCWQRKSLESWKRPAEGSARHPANRSTRLREAMRNFSLNPDGDAPSRPSKECSADATNVTSPTIYCIQQLGQVFLIG